MNSVSEACNSRLRKFDMKPNFGIAHSNGGEFSECCLNIHSADSLIRNRIDCQDAFVFDQISDFAYVDNTMDMREKLRHIMTANKDTANSLAEKSGVPQPTISRFLSGKHGDPRSSTIKSLAKAYGLTENQLRGDADIDFHRMEPAPARDPILDDLELLPEEDVAYYRALIRKEAAAIKREQQPLIPAAQSEQRLMGKKLLGLAEPERRIDDTGAYHKRVVDTHITTPQPCKRKVKK